MVRFVKAIIMLIWVRILRLWFSLKQIAMLKQPARRNIPGTFGPEEWLTRDFLECARGNISSVPDDYLRIWDGVTMPGFTKDGRGGASVNQMVLAGGIAAYKNHPLAKQWWIDVVAFWGAEGAWSIEDGTRNIYFDWNLWPVIAAWRELGVDGCNDVAVSIWARVALGASNKPARYGRMIGGDPGMWTGFATTFCGARSWRFAQGVWRHLEKSQLDWMIHWATTGSMANVPGWDQFSAECIRAGLPSGLTAGQMNSLLWVIDGDVERLDQVVAMANRSTVAVPLTIRRTTGGVATIRGRSINGNTGHLYGASFDRASQWHEWLAHGDGKRPNRSPGMAWIDDPDATAQSNDGAEGPVSVSMPSGELIYEVYCSAKGEFEIIYPLSGVDPLPPPEHAEPERPFVIGSRFPWRLEGAEHWRDVPRRPLAGSYSGGVFQGYDMGSDQATLAQCVLCQDHGVNIIAHVWRGSNDAHITPKIPTLPRSMAIAMDDRPGLPLRWCIFMGNVLIQGRPPQTVPDFDQPAFRSEWIKSLTTTLFDHGWMDDPLYWRIDGHPVLVIFRAHQFIGDYAGAVNEVTDFWCEKKAVDPYFLGMTGRWHVPWSEADSRLVSTFHGCTAWSATAGTPNDRQDLSAVAEFIAPNLISWRDGCKAIGVDFFPSVTGQYDKTLSGGSEDAVRYARTRADFKAVVDVAIDSIDAGVWIQTLDEWPEGSAIEPVHNNGEPDDRYRNNYGLDFMKEISRIGATDPDVPEPEPDPDPDPHEDCPPLTEASDCSNNLDRLCEEVMAQDEGRAGNRIRQALTHCPDWDDPEVITHLEAMQTELAQPMVNWARMGSRMAHIHHISRGWS